MLLIICCSYFQLITLLFLNMINIEEVIDDFQNKLRILIKLRGMC